MTDIAKAFGMIKSMADSMTLLKKQLDECQQRLAAHDQEHKTARSRLSGHNEMLGTHGREIAHHGDRLGKLERDRGEPSSQSAPVYKIDQTELRKNFRANFGR